jgi:hypothetical protein
MKTLRLDGGNTYPLNITSNAAGCQSTILYSTIFNPLDVTVYPLFLFSVPNSESFTNKAVYNPSLFD